MYRCASRLLGPLLPRSYLVAVQVRVVSRGLSSVHEDHETDYAAARTWAAELNKDTIPRSIARVRFDRSSGKGGQHVNT
jgi:protein subunit release factor B